MLIPLKSGSLNKKLHVRKQVNPFAVIYLGNHLLPVLSDTAIKQSEQGVCKRLPTALFFPVADAFDIPYRLEKTLLGGKNFGQALLKATLKPTRSYAPKLTDRQRHGGCVIDNDSALREVKNIILEQTKAESLGFIPAWILIYKPGNTEVELANKINDQIVDILDTLSWGTTPKIDRKHIKKIIDALLKDNKPKIIDIFPYLDFLIPNAYDSYEKKLMLELLSFEAEQKILYDTYKGKALMPKGARFNYLDGGGAIKYDYYENRIEMPPGLSFNEWMKGFSSFADKYLNTTLSKNPYTTFSDFYPWKTNSGLTPNGPARGDILDIDVWGPNNASVMISDVNYSSGIDSKVTFSTMDVSNLNPKYHEMTKLTKKTVFSTTGSHVVSGNRIWGFRKKDDGIYSYTIGLSKVIDKTMATSMETLFKFTSWYDGTISQSNGIQNLNWITFHIANNQFLKGKFLEQNKMWKENVFYKTSMTICYSDENCVAKFSKRAFPSFHTNSVLFIKFQSTRFYKDYNIKHDSMYRQDLETKLNKK